MQHQQEQPMVLRRYIPKAPSAVIDSIWEMVADAGDFAIDQPVPPMGCPELLFFVGQSSPLIGVTAPRCIVKGQYTQLQTVQFHSDFHLLILRLKPFGLHQLLGVRADTLVDAVVDGEAWPLMQEMADLLAAGPTMESAVLRLVALVEAHSDRPISFETLRFLELLGQSNSHKVDEIIRQQGIGLRNLQRHFAREVGLSPKKYLQIRRILAMQNEIAPQPDWLQFVAEYEFTDQSHLVKEFKQVMRHTPTEFMRKQLGLKQILPPPKPMDL